MKTATLAGDVLIALGIVSLVYQGISYTTENKVVDIGSLHAMEEQKHRIPLPPVLGGLSVVGGIILMVAGAKGNG